MKKSQGFTLAEVLIVLGIVGVVAALTLPTLISNVTNKIAGYQATVFNSKLLKGMNLTKLDGGLNDTYESTYDFLINGLGKHLKMVSVCRANEINKCIPYDKIKYNDKSGVEKTIDVTSITDASKLNLKAPFEDVAAFVLADGTPAIVSYNKKCIVDSDDKADKTINACLAGVYDINGTRNPNKYAVNLDTDGKSVKSYIGDLRAFNGASIGSSCTRQIGDVCIVSTAIMADYPMLNLIQAVDPSYTMPRFTVGDYTDCCYDYWTLAKDYCNKVQNGSHLPDSEDLAKISRVLYSDNSISNADDNDDLNWDTNKDAVFAALGITDNPSWFYLWSSSPDGDELAHQRYFDSSSTGYGSNYRGDGDHLAVCLGD